jgi:hypothetical protein
LLTPAAGRIHVLLLDPDRLGAEVLHDQRIVRERRRGREDEGEGGEEGARGTADARRERAAPAATPTKPEHA